MFFKVATLALARKKVAGQWRSGLELHHIFAPLATGSWVILSTTNITESISAVILGWKQLKFGKLSLNGDYLSSGFIETEW